MRRTLRHTSLPETLPASGAAVLGPVLLASITQRFPEAAIKEAIDCASDTTGVYVVSAARIYGTALGMPHPGLYPNKQERAAHKTAVATAVRTCEQTGIAASGEVMATRHPARMLARRARQHGCSAIVISAGDRPRLTMINWSGEPYRLPKKTELPVQLIEEPQ